MNIIHWVDITDLNGITPRLWHTEDAKLTKEILIRDHQVINIVYIGRFGWDGYFCDLEFKNEEALVEFKLKYL